MKMQLLSNHDTSLGSMTCLGSSLLIQIDGLPQTTNLGSLYNLLTHTVCCPPNHSLNAGKNLIPPRISSKIAYST